MLLYPRENYKNLHHVKISRHTVFTVWLEILEGYNFHGNPRGKIASGSRAGSRFRLLEHACASRGVVVRYVNGGLWAELLEDVNPRKLNREMFENSLRSTVDSVKLLIESHEWTVDQYQEEQLTSE